MFKLDWICNGVYECVYLPKTKILILLLISNINHIQWQPCSWFHMEFNADLGSAVCLKSYVQLHEIHTLELCLCIQACVNLFNTLFCIFHNNHFPKNIRTKLEIFLQCKIYWNWSGFISKFKMFKLGLSVIQTFEMEL